jgi:hypothetical protein
MKKKKMKTMTLIIIGIVVVASITAIFTTDFLNDKKITASDNTPEQLRTILKHCIDSKIFVGTVSLSYYNDTHKINNVNCKWVENEKSYFGNT